MVASLRELSAKNTRKEDLWFHKSQQKMDAMLQDHRVRETARRVSLNATMMRERRARVRLWQRIMRGLTNERGPWSTRTRRKQKKARDDDEAREPTGGDQKEGIEEPEARVYWKLDKTENHARMRLRLKVNYEGTDHKDASPDTGANEG